MTLLFWGLTIGVIGKSLVAIAVLLAHHTIAHEHKIDRSVLRSFRIEFVITLVGLICILIGYGLELAFYDAHDIVFTTLIESNP